MSAYSEFGYTFLNEVLPEDESLKLADRFLKRLDESVLKIGESSMGGHSEYYVFDGPKSFEVSPELEALYLTLTDNISEIVGKECIISPHERSCVNVKAYIGPSAGQGMHYDTNPVTVLLFLRPGEATLYIKDLRGVLTTVKPKAGSLLVMQGRKCLHWVKSDPSNIFRVTAPLNYYHPDDQERPSWIDEAIYEGESIGESDKIQEARAWAMARASVV